MKWPHGMGNGKPSSVDRAGIAPKIRGKLRPWLADMCWMIPGPRPRSLNPEAVITAMRNVSSKVGGQLMLRVESIIAHSDLP